MTRLTLFGEAVSGRVRSSTNSPEESTIMREEESSFVAPKLGLRAGNPAQFFDTSDFAGLLTRPKLFVHIVWRCGLMP